MQGRSYDELTHEIQQNTYEADRNMLRIGVTSALESSPLLAMAPAGMEADMWVFFNVCPTEDMSVDIFVRDHGTGAIVSRQNAKLNRPYPGKSSQLCESALRTLRDRFLKKLEKSVQERYFTTP